MKKIITLICVAIMGIGCASAQADKGNFAVGANVVYGSWIKNAGVGLRFQYTPINNVRAELGMNYFFQKDYVNMWDLNLNAEYLIGLFEHKLYLYPIVGLSYAQANADNKKLNKDFEHLLEEEIEIESDKAFGLNLGAGIEYRLTERVGVTLEYRHSIMKDIDQGVVGIGANYKF